MKIINHHNRIRFRIPAYVFFVLFTVISIPSLVFSLEQMTPGELKGSSAQAGVTIGLVDIGLYVGDPEITISDTGDAAPGYITFAGIENLYLLNSGNVDVDGDGTVGQLTIDIGSVEDTNSAFTASTPAVILKCDDWQQQTFTTVDTIDFFGTDIGSLKSVGFEIPKWHCYIGAHDEGTGIDIEAGFQLDLASFNYIYNDSGIDNSFSLTGHHMAQSFTGDPTSPATWVSEDKFLIGKINSPTADDTLSPLTIDIGGRTIQDAVGNPVTEPIIVLTMTGSGSIRTENITMGAQNFGPTAIDGITVHRMLVELPGRHLGN